jgi:hypothetical protein
VEGDKIAEAAGNEKVFSGPNALDPIFHATGDSATLSLPPWDEGYYAQMREWGADIARVPVSPQAWLAAGELATSSLRGHKAKGGQR